MENKYWLVPFLPLVLLSFFLFRGSVRAQLAGNTPTSTPAVVVVPSLTDRLIALNNSDVNQMLADNQNLNLLLSQYARKADGYNSCLARLKKINLLSK